MDSLSRDRIWKSKDVVTRFLTGVRAAIPLASEQLAVMMDLLMTEGRSIQTFLDLGCGDGV